MATVTTSRRKEPVETSYPATPLYQCPTDGSVKSATITHAMATNYTSTNASITVADVVSGTPGADEAATNEYVPLKTIPAMSSVSLPIVGDSLLSGAFINAKASAADSIIFKISVREELNG